MQRLHLDDPPRADRRGRPDRALELPADDGGVEDRAGAGRRQHGRAQAVRDDPADDAEAGRAGRRDLPQGRAQRDHRPRRSGRPGAGHPPRRRHGLADRLGGDRQVDRQARRRHAQARPPGARRQGAGRRVRRRRPRDRAGDDRRHRLLQRRPGLHRGHPRAGRRRRSTTMWSAGWPSRPGACVLGRHPVRRHDARAAELAPASASASRASWSGAPTTPRSSPAEASPIGPASSSSRPSSPACTRTTR